MLIRSGRRRAAVATEFLYWRSRIHDFFYTTSSALRATLKSHSREERKNNNIGGGGGGAWVRVFLGSPYVGRGPNGGLTLTRRRLDIKWQLPHEVVEWRATAQLQRRSELPRSS